MSRARVVALAAAAAAVLAVAVSVAAGAAGPVTGLSGVDPLTGKQVSLDQWRGRPLAINVWASWCEGCNDEAQALKRFARAHPNSLLGIDYQDSKAGARAFYRRYGFDHPSIFDPTGRLRAKVKAFGLPWTVFLNRRHVAVYAIAGAATLKQLETGWKKAVATRR